MANEKFTQLPTVTSASLSDIIAAVQAGVSSQETLGQIFTLMLSNTVLHNAGNPNGSVAGVVYQFCWDTTNAVLYTCTTSGNAGTAVWTLAGSVTFPVPVTKGGTGLSSTTINQILYSSSNNVIAGLATANNSVLSTGAGGVPVLSSVLPGGLTTTDPVVAQGVATKNYVDTIAQGITVQGACYAGTTANLTATYNNGTSGVGATLTNSGAQAAFSVDSVSPALNARVLVKNQSTAAQNGIYTLTTVGSGATNWVLTRATDYDLASQINPGDLVVLTAGSTQANSSWLQTATVTTIGTDAISFSQFTASLPVGVPAGGTGLTTTTAYGLITGGTTATGNFQNAGTGTSGQIYISAGSAALGNWTSLLPLASGGTNAALTASNGGIIYSTASALAVLSGTATAGLALLSGSSTTPTWSNLPPITRVNVQTFTSGGTYTKTAGTQYALAYACGGGGGGGGAATGGGTTYVGAGGGAAGSEAIVLLTSAQLGASQTVTLGAAGTAGTAGANNGGQGGTTSLGSLFSCPGGNGGNGVASGSSPALGGTGTTPTITTGIALATKPGMPGGTGMAGGTFIVGFSGNGGSSNYGTGGLGVAATSNASGNAGSGYGSGGSGGADNSGNQTGGAGTAGYMSILEFISS